MKKEEKEFLKKSKEIVKLIAKKELKENQIKGVDILPVTKTENIVHIIKENLKNSKEKNYSILDSVTNILSQIENSNVAGGEFYLNKKNIKIYLSTIKYYQPDYHQYLFYLVYYIYHELKHAIIWNQIEMQENINDNFYYLLDDMAISLYNNYYNKNYYTIYEEIIATKYGYKKAIEKFKKHDKIYKKVVDQINRDKMFNKIYENSYDMQKTVNNIHYLLKIKSDEQNILNSKFSENYFSMLYNPVDITYKSLNELFLDPDWNKLSLEIRYLIVSSESYLSELDYFNITKEELDFLINALIYSYELEKKKYRNNKRYCLSVNKLKIENKRKEMLEEQLEENLFYNTDKMSKIKSQLEKIKTITPKKMLKKTKKLY